MQKGQMDVYYNYELDELFMIKRGVIIGKYMLETYDGTSRPYDNFEDLEKISNLFENAIFITEI